MTFFTAQGLFWISAIQVAHFVHEAHKQAGLDKHDEEQEEVYGRK